MPTRARAPGLRAMRVAGHAEAPRRVPGDGDADARADDRGFGRRRPIIDDGDAALRRDQVGAIEEAIDPQRLAGLGRTVGHVDQATSSRPSRLHRLDAAERGKGADEHRPGLAVAAGHGVCAPVHPVGEVHVQVPWRAEHHLGARGRAPVGVTRRVLGTEVGLDLDDPTGTGAVEEHLVQQLGSDAQGASGIERPAQAPAAAHRGSPAPVVAHHRRPGPRTVQGPEPGATNAARP